MHGWLVDPQVSFAVYCLPLVLLGLPVYNISDALLLLHLVAFEGPLRPDTVPQSLMLHAPDVSLPARMRRTRP